MNFCNGTTQSEIRPNERHEALISVVPSGALLARPRLFDSVAAASVSILNPTQTWTLSNQCNAMQCNRIHYDGWRWASAAASPARTASIRRPPRRAAACSSGARVVGELYLHVPQISCSSSSSIRQCSSCPPRVNERNESSSLFNMDIQ